MTDQAQKTYRYSRWVTEFDGGRPVRAYQEYADRIDGPWLGGEPKGYDPCICGHLRREHSPVGFERCSYVHCDCVSFALATGHSATTELATVVPSEGGPDSSSVEPGPSDDDAGADDRCNHGNVRDECYVCAPQPLEKHLARERRKREQAKVHAGTAKPIRTGACADRRHDHCDGRWVVHGQHGDSSGPCECACHDVSHARIEGRVTDPHEDIVRAALEAVVPIFGNPCLDCGHTNGNHAMDGSCRGEYVQAALRKLASGPSASHVDYRSMYAEAEAEGDTYLRALNTIIDMAKRSDAHPDLEFGEVAQRAIEEAAGLKKETPS